MVVLSKTGIGAMFAMIGAMCAGICFITKMLPSWDQLLGNEDDTNKEMPKRRFMTKLMRIPAKNIGTVLGRGGANVRRIEFETKTFIRIVYYDKTKMRAKIKSQDQDGSDVEKDWFEDEKINPQAEDEGTFVEIRGENRERINLAWLAIRGLVADSLMPQVTKHFCAEPHVVGSIIGKDGVNLRRLQRNFKVRIEVDNNTDSTLRKISITGTEEAVALAEARMMQLMSRGRHGISNIMDDDEIPLEEKMMEVAMLKKQFEEGEDEVWC